MAATFSWAKGSDGSYLGSVSGTGQDLVDEHHDVTWSRESVTAVGPIALYKAAVTLVSEE